jgi:hypothetical protein
VVPDGHFTLTSADHAAPSQLPADMEPRVALPARSTAPGRRALGRPHGPEAVHRYERAASRPHEGRHHDREPRAFGCTVALNPGD